MIPKEIWVVKLDQRFISMRSVVSASVGQQLLTADFDDWRLSDSVSSGHQHLTVGHNFDRFWSKQTARGELWLHNITCCWPAASLPIGIDCRHAGGELPHVAQHGCNNRRRQQPADVTAGIITAATAAAADIEQFSNAELHLVLPHTVRLGHDQTSISTPLELGTFIA